MIYLLLLPFIIPALLYLAIKVVQIIYEHTPADLLNTFDDLADSHYVDALACIKRAQQLNNNALFFNVTAPVVVPFILLFTKWNDEKLAFWDEYYGNNVSINGDKFVWAIDETTGKQFPLPVSFVDNEETRALAYWVGGKHHPRSFYARYVWLGIRNRAAKYSQSLGVDVTPFNDDREYWGDPDTSRSNEGTVLFRCGPLYQLHHIAKISDSRCIRVNCGFKIWRQPDFYSPIAPPVDIRMSWTKWTGS